MLENVSYACEQMSLLMLNPEWDSCRQGFPQAGLWEPEPGPSEWQDLRSREEGREGWAAFFPVPSSKITHRKRHFLSSWVALGWGRGWNYYLKGAETSRAGKQGPPPETIIVASQEAESQGLKGEAFRVWQTRVSNSSLHVQAVWSWRNSPTC